MTNWQELAEKDPEDTRVKLEEDFQRKVFIDAINKYGSKTLAKKLNISRGMIYHYRNNRVDNIALYQLQKLKDMLRLERKSIEEEIIEEYSFKESVTDILEEGREIRKEKARENFSVNISLDKVIKNHTLDVIRWLEETTWIKKIQGLNGLVRKVGTLDITEERIKIEFEIYKRARGFEKNNICLPRTIPLNPDFFYFLGLRLGDGTSGARVGVSNKDFNILKEASEYLENTLLQETRMEVFTYENITNEVLNQVKKWCENQTSRINVCEIRNHPGDYVCTIYSTNNILARVLDSVINNFKPLLHYMNFEDRGAFLAGVFDAEGNINKRDRNLRFSQKTQENVKLIQELLEVEGYRTRYDGDNILIAHREGFRKRDLSLFEKQVLPYLKSIEKKKQVNDILNGYFVKDNYRKIVKIIAENPGITQREIAKKINRTKCHSKLSALRKANYIKKEGNPGQTFKYQATNLGLNWLGE